jgi:quercetin 2,3-dioxygenase
MIQVFPAKERFFADHGWLKSYFSFSFAHYFDPNNMMFGPMRVLNDDVVKPLRGFGAHPHEEMEIVSIVLKGQLKHEDSTGQSAITTFGGIQRMTAGTGVVHSEVNPSDTEEVNFLQMWFVPDTPGLPPSYEKTEFDVNKLKNQLLPVVSKKLAGEGVAYIHQDLTIYLSDLEKENELTFTQQPDRYIFFFVIEGSVTLNDEFTLGRRDSARITDVTKLHIKANKDSRFMLIDLPSNH